MIDAQRVTELLNEAGIDVVVTGLRSEAVGTGQMGESHRLFLDYDRDAGLPSTLVAKLASGPPGKRAIAAGSYRTELGFYNDLAPTLEVRAPKCWASWISDDSTDFVLLLEDLAPMTQGDQIEGCTVTQARAAAVNLAGLHGPRWCDDSLTTGSGLGVIDQEQADGLGQAMVATTQMFLARYGDRLSTDDQATMEQSARQTGAWIGGRLDRFSAVHGDYRLDNLMFSADGTEVAAVDWQTLSRGLPSRDIAFLCGTGLRTDDRRSGERDIVAAYHEALTRYDVGDYDLDACWDDYSFGMLQGPLIIVFGSAVATPTERGDEMFMAMTERACAAIRDLGSLDLI